MLSLGRGGVLEAAQAPVIMTSNVTFRIMAANLSSGNNQRYETPGLNILRGLKPDIVAIQEFNYASTGSAGVNTAAAFREMIDGAFGTNFVYFRETSNSFTIPNGVISRWPILASGSWDDTLIPDRGFCWARIDLPGTNDLYVVSVHLKASSSSSGTRSSEATALKTLITTNFPTYAWVVVAGDFNLSSRSETALTTFKTFLSDSPIPADAGGDQDTNSGRDNPYDCVLPSFTLATNFVPVAVGTQTFNSGLVFDSRVFTPLTTVSPVQSTDSAATGMQHMAVMKDFRVSYTVTNYLTVPTPVLVLASNRVIKWTGLSNLVYTVQSRTNLAVGTNWSAVGTRSSGTTNFSFPLTNSAERERFYRVTYP